MIDKIKIKPFKAIRIEINSDCNRRCVFCPRSKDETRWKIDKKNKKKLINKKMSDDLVLSILDQNVDQGFNAIVGFDFYNEPTLDPRLFKFLSYALSKKCPTEIVTNGDTIKKDKEYAQEFFSLVSYTNISLYDYKDQEGRNKLVGWWHNYLDSLKISRRRYQLVGEYFNFGNRAGTVDRRNKYMGGSHLDSKVPLRVNCKKIHSKMNIRYDGEVPICCEDALVQHSLGNVHDNTLSEIWYGQKMKRATYLLMQGKRSEIDPCNKCVKGISKPIFM
jgi:radical SAM protein with 4Fe4S-binding SPASM domain